MTPVPLPLPDVVPLLRGAQVALRPPQAADVGVVARLGVDPTIERFFAAERGTRRGLTSGEAQGALARLQAGSGTQGWVIDLDGRLIGLARLFGVELDEGRARYAITFLARRHLGRGLGTEATRLVLTYAFAVLGLHRVTARVLAFNERALACFGPAASWKRAASARACPSRASATTSC